jgi:hypothetical protein
MCIISGPVNSVKGTKIFVMPSKEGRQLVVYKNEVESPAENLMILPVPHPESVQFETALMKRYKDLFSDLRSSLHWFSPERSVESGGWATRSASDTISVLSVGSYRASVVFSVHELNRLNKSIFKIPKDLEQMLWDEYGRFGFVCAVLKEGVQDYEPLAYSHKRFDQELMFVPTKHYHTHDHSHPPFTQKGEADWAHTVYSLRTVREANHCDGFPSERNRIDFTKMPKEFQRSQGEPVHCWMKSGVWENKDLEFRISPY